jgi:3-hydroxyacyl-[acyl-carrier-protein] dehydratase
MSALKQAIVASASSEFVSPAEGEGRQQFTFQQDFPGFSGHFDNRPILPGIVQMLAAQIVLEQLQGQSLVLEAVPKAKFLNVLKPGQEVLVRCKKIPDKKNIRFSVEISSSEGAAANLEMGFRISE